MIQALKELGEYKLKRENRDASDILSILVQNPNQTKRSPLVFVPVFNLKENKLSYSHILLEETDKEKSIRYLYRRASSQGPNYTPTCITGEDFQRRRKFLEIRSNFYQYVISVLLSKAKENLPPEISGIRFISKTQLEEFYDYETGFKVNSETLIW